MTSVGHSLMGTAIGIFCVPRRTSPRWKVGYFAAFVVLPNIPDLPFPYWGHDRYDISHSLFVNLVLCLIMASLLGRHPNIRHSIGDGKVLRGGVATWLSHLLLDSFYNHGRGVAIFWPLSEAHLALPMPWFSVAPFPPLSLALLRECAIEFASYSPLVLLAYSLRRSGLFQRASHSALDSALANHAANGRPVSRSSKASLGNCTNSASPAEFTKYRERQRWRRTKAKAESRLGQRSHLPSHIESAYAQLGNMSSG